MVGAEPKSDDPGWRWLKQTRRTTATAGTTAIDRAGTATGGTLADAVDVIVTIGVVCGPADRTAVREEPAAADPEPAAPMAGRSAAAGTMTAVRAPTDAVGETAARRHAVTGTETTGVPAATAARETVVTIAARAATTADTAVIGRAGLAVTAVRSSGTTVGLGATDVRGTVAMVRAATTAAPGASGSTATAVVATGVKADGATTADPVVMTGAASVVMTAVGLAGTIAVARAVKIGVVPVVTIAVVPVATTGAVPVVTTGVVRAGTSGAARAVAVRIATTTDPVCRRARRSRRGSRVRSCPRRSARSCVPSRRRPRTAWHGTWSPPAS